jgi:hypothetical protein
MAGLPEPKVVANLANRGKVIDAAVDGAMKPAPAPAAPAPAPEPVSKPTTAAESQARIDAMKAKWAADEEKVKGMPKPGLLDRAKKLVGL